MSGGDQNARLARALGVTKPPPLAPLGSWPTPVEPLDVLGEELGLELFVKRDDLGGALYGGNKVRKLEFLLGAARQRGCRSVITIGGVGSNQIIGTAVYARELGMETHAVVFPQPVTAAVAASIRRAAALGVRLTALPDPNALPEVLERMHAPEPTELIPAGGSSPAGNLAFVAAAFELAEQVRAGSLPEPEEIFVALGSGGTLAGLALGMHLAGLRTCLVGVRAAPEDAVNEAVVRRQITALGGLLRRAGAAVKPPPDLPFGIVHDQYGAAYGMPTPGSERALRTARERAGLALDATYTAKAFAAILEGAATTQRVLFWNTANGRDLVALPTSDDAQPVPEEIESWLVRDRVEAPGVS